MEEKLAQNGTSIIQGFAVYCRVLCWVPLETKYKFSSQNLSNIDLQEDKINIIKFIIYCRNNDSIKHLLLQRCQPREIQIREIANFVWDYMYLMYQNVRPGVKSLLKKFWKWHRSRLLQVGKTLMWFCCHDTLIMDSHCAFTNHSLKYIVLHHLRGPIRGFRDAGYLGKKSMGYRIFGGILMGCGILRAEIPGYWVGKLLIYERLN